MIQLSLSVCQYQYQGQARLILTKGTSLETEMNELSDETRLIADDYVTAVV